MDGDSHSAHSDEEENKEEIEEPVDEAKSQGGADVPKLDISSMSIGERIKKDPLELDIMRKLPNFPEFLTIPKINESRSVWRTGMRKIEEVFAEHIANMHLDFEGKANHYEKI